MRQRCRSTCKSETTIVRLRRALYLNGLFGIRLSAVTAGLTMQYIRRWDLAYLGALGKQLDAGLEDVGTMDAAIEEVSA